MDGHNQWFEYVEVQLLLCRQDMVALARRYLSDHADAEDAVQEVCVSLLRRRESSPLGPGYIRSCVINRCRKKWRQRQASRITFDLTSADIPFHDAASSNWPAEETARGGTWLRQQLTKLNPKRAMVIRLMLQGKSVQKIARQMGVETQTVRSHYHAAIADLRRAAGSTTAEAPSTSPRKKRPRPLVNRKPKQE